MSKKLTLPDPGRFNLASFAEILPHRDPIIGEDPGSFKAFHQGLMQSLAPTTPYECVIAENLIAIEWELLQHRRMREAAIRRLTRTAVRKAVVSRERDEYEVARDEAWGRHAEAGGTEDDWEEPFEFDEDAASTAGEELAARATSSDLDEQIAASEEIADLGMDIIEVMSRAYMPLHSNVADFGMHPVEVMSNVYTDWGRQIQKHDGKAQELEKRRREVRRDFDALQKTRPIEGEIIEG